MFKKSIYALIVSALLFTGCGTTQSILKSTFPYTTELTISSSAKPGDSNAAVSLASSFDQNFSGDRNTAYKISDIHLTSARIRSVSPTSFNIGNVTEVKVFMSDPKGGDEIMVASRTDITPNVGNNLILDIDNSQKLDQLIRLPHVKIRMTYKLRNAIGTDSRVQLILGLRAKPE